MDGGIFCRILSPPVLGEFSCSHSIYASEIEEGDSLTLFLQSRSNSSTLPQDTSSESGAVSLISINEFREGVLHR